MAPFKIVFILLTVYVSSGQGLPITSDRTIIGQLLDRLKVGLIETPNDLFGFLYNIAAVTGSGILNSLAGCKVGHNEDADSCRNVTEMIRSRGFEVEEYDIVTEDGYILNIQRVINPLVDSAYRSSKRPVIIQPGISVSASDFVINSLYVEPIPWPPVNRSQSIVDGQDQLSEAAEDQKHPRSLAFYLSNRGYDVFLANNRGTRYGQRHVNRTILDPEFWNFSFDEQIDYDLPATIKFIQRLTGHQKIAFIGWSQGAALMFGLQADHPEYADIIEPFVAIAPTVSLGNVDTFLSRYIYKLWLLLPYSNMGLYFSDLSLYLLRQLCGKTSVQRYICTRYVLFPIFGPDQPGFEVERIPTYLHHTPSGASMKNVVHYPQLHSGKKFVRFNLGPAGNRVKYGTDSPPEYDLRRIKSKWIVLVTADTDYLANPRDIRTLIANLTVKPYRWFNITKEVRQFSHISFAYHKRAGVLVNRHVAGVLDEIDQQLR